MSEPEQARSSAVKQLWEEVVRVWHQMPNKLLFSVMVLPWIALFQFWGNSTFGYIKTHSLFQWLHYVSTTSPDDGHCLLIPFIVAALFWWKRQELIDVPKRACWPALGLVVAALLLHVTGYMAQQGRISIVAFCLGIYGVMGMVWGPKWLRTSFFPFFLLVFCIPIGTMADALTVPLRLLVSTVAAGISQWGLGIEVVREGTQLFGPQGAFQYDVAAACSGIRSLTVLLALTTIYGFMTFRSWWKRLLMVAIAIPLAVIGNVVRITGVIITAEAFGQQAGLRFHDSAGFVTFLIAIVCVMALGAGLREEVRPRPVEGPAA